MEAKTIYRIWSNEPFAGIMATGRIEICAGLGNSKMTLITIGNRHENMISIPSDRFEIYNITGENV